MANVLSTALSALRQGFMESRGEWVGNSTSGAGNAGGTTLVDATNLINFADDYFNPYWALLTSGTYSGQVRHVYDSAQSTGIVTVIAAYGGQVASGVSYELLKYHPTNDIRQVLNVALRLVFPMLGRWISNTDLIGGNWLPNGGIRDWDVSTAPNKWALVGGGASVTKDTTTLWGLPSAALVRVGNDCYIHCSEVEWPGLIDLGGTTIRFEAWVYATVASRARLSVYVNGASVGASSYHTGGSTPELLRTDEITITDSPTSISFRCEVNTGNTTAYFAKVRVIGPPNSKYLLPLAFSLEPPTRLALQNVGTAHGNERPCDDLWETYPYVDVSGWKVAYDDADGNWYLRFINWLPPAGYTMKLYGKEYLSTVSADTDTVPFEAAQAEVLYAKASEILERKLGRLDESLRWAQIYKELVKQHGRTQELPIMNYSTAKW